MEFCFVTNHELRPIARYYAETSAAGLRLSSEVARITDWRGHLVPC